MTKKLPTRVGLPSRRSFVQTAGGIITAGAVSSANTSLASENVPQANRKVALRVAHMTDIHLQPELRGAEGLAACFRHIEAQTPKPEFILCGGDHIMNSFAQPAARVDLQWKLWKSVVAAESHLPIYSCLGNQDIFGWNKAQSGATGAEPRYGKKWALEVLELVKPYYSFSRSGWHFITLDGVQPGDKDGTISGFLDDEQFDWLTGELASIPKSQPILIWSHVPILSVLPLLMAQRETPHGHALVAAGNVHTDTVKVVSLLAQYPNIKACLSGHLHRVEHVEFRGLNFYSTGAVCGNWWKGAHDGFAEGYALLDLFEDGSHDYRYVSYDWQAANA